MILYIYKIFNAFFILYRHIIQILFKMKTYKSLLRTISFMFLFAILVKSVPILCAIFKCDVNKIIILPQDKLKMLLHSNVLVVLYDTNL